MSNSKLVNYKKLSPYNSGRRTHKIDTVSIHCVVGQMSALSLGYEFSKPFKNASSNYGIGYDGEIGCYVNEDSVSWCTSSQENDNRAVTIEVASDTFAPYKVTNKAYKSLITLLADICIRNNIKELKWKADKSLIGQVDKQNMTVHRWFNPGKSCPGDYLYNLHGQIAKEVNERINCGFKIGKKVRFTKNKNIYKADCKTRVKYSSLNKNWKAKSHKGITGKAVFDKGETAILKAIEHKNGKVFGVFGGKNYRILLVDKKGKKTGKQ